MIFKKLAALTLCAVMMATPVSTYAYSSPFSASGARIPGLDEKTSGDYKYVLYSNGKAGLTQYTGSSVNIVIPSEIDGYEVVTLQGTFDSCEDIVSVTIPETVTLVAGNAFYGCDKLQHVLFPDTLKGIDASAFYDCYSLEEIRIPSSVTEIGASAFMGCTSLRTVYVPDSVTHVGLNAFEETPFLTDNISDFVTVGDGVLICYKGSYPDPKIPDTVKRIGDGAFSYFITPFVATSLSATLISSVAIPDSVTEIGYRAFCGSNITSIDIPKSVKSVGGEAFRLSALKSAVVPTTVEEWGDNCFGQCQSLKTVTIPSGIETLPIGMFWACTALDNVTIPDTVTEISDFCFDGCSAIKKITVPETVQNVGEYAFRDCTSLERIDFEGKDTFIKSNTFSGSTDVVIYCYNGSRAHQRAVSDNLNFVLYDPPESDSDTESDTDSDTESDTDTSTDLISDENYDYSHNDVYDCIQIAKYKGNDATVTIDDHGNILTIGEGAFENNKTLETIVLSEWTGAIGNGAFRNCTSLKEIRFFTDNHFLGILEQEAFAGCTSLESVKVPYGVLFIWDGAFKDCTSLKEAELPELIDTIYADTFKNCTSLRDVTIPESVKTIEPTAFDGCENLTVHCAAGSVAEEFAKSKGFKVDTAQQGDGDDKTGTCGDLDGDGEVTANDALTALRASVGLEQMTEQIKTLADVDGDGEVTANDALAMLRYSVGLGDGGRIGKPVQ